ncbi:Uncharacterised protein [Pragia fontium]|nr:Uncharacterised protein [Pragia fontium]
MIKMNDQHSELKSLLQLTNITREPNLRSMINRDNNTHDICICCTDIFALKLSSNLKKL